ncbi:MAG: glutaredoxin family protein [Gammaproteobacteria bacterium]
MPILLRMLILTYGLVAAAGSQAVTVVECVDADGNASFMDKCPPGWAKKSEKLIRRGGPREPSLSEIAAANPIIFYTVPDCDACDLVRNAMTGRNIPFRERDVQDNAEMQQELQEVSGGLTVPALKIGDRVLSGYSRDAIDDALADAGYPVEGAENPITLPPEEDADADSDDEFDEDTVDDEPEDDFADADDEE